VTPLALRHTGQRLAGQRHRGGRRLPLDLGEFARAERLGNGPGGRGLRVNEGQALHRIVQMRAQFDPQP